MSQVSVWVGCTPLSVPSRHWIHVGEGVFDVLWPWAIGEGKIKAGNEQGPVFLTRIQSLYSEELPVTYIVISFNGRQISRKEGHWVEFGLFPWVLWEDGPDTHFWCIYLHYELLGEVMVFYVMCSDESFLELWECLVFWGVPLQLFGPLFEQGG